jgi:DNA-binding PadR family transcriptional regulator
MGKNEIDLVVLGSLMAGPAHGYQIKKRIADTFGDQYLHLSDSAVYPRLIRLDKEGLIKSQMQVQNNAPNKKVYQLTEAGLQKIKELAATPVN